MEIAENGPEINHADIVLKAAMNKYCQKYNVHQDGKWHFIRTSTSNRIIDRTNIMRGFIKAQMRRVGQTNPQIQRYKVSSPIAKADAKVAVIQLD